MKRHLPECDTQHNGQLPCICAALEVCEARVREQYATDWQTEQEAVHLAGLDLAYRKGVQSARDAVDAVPPIDQRVDDNGLISLVYDKGEIIAAIDALKEDE